MKWVFVAFCVAPGCVSARTLERSGREYTMRDADGTGVLLGSDVVRSEHGVYVSRDDGVHLYRSTNDHIHLWRWSAVASNGDDVVVWCDVTSSLRSLSGEWSWNPYASGTKPPSGVPQLHFVRGTVVLVWPGSVVCVRRGTDVCRVRGSYLGVCGGYALVQYGRGVGCIDFTGKFVSLPRIPGKPLRVSGGALVVKQRGRLCMYRITSLLSGRVVQVRTKV